MCRGGGSDRKKKKKKKTIGICLFFVLMHYIKFQVPVSWWWWGGGGRGGGGTETKTLSQTVKRGIIQNSSHLHNVKHVVQSTFQNT